MKLKNLTFAEAKRELSEHGIRPLKDGPRVKNQVNTNQKALLISENQVAKYVKALPDEGMQYLREMRGLTRQVIDHYGIGWCEEKERFTIPIPQNGEYVNVRLYHPNKNLKVLPISPGRSIQLYPEDQLKNDELWLCEGELDALCAISNGLPAVSVTGGAGSWKDEFTSLLKSKRVNIVYDCDEAGIKGGEKIAGILSKIAQVKIIDLGLKQGEDLTNWFGDYGKSKGELEKLASETPVFGKVAPARIEDTDLGFTQSRLDSLLEKAVPERGYIANFMDAYSQCTDAPRAFLFAAAVVSLASVLSDRILLPWAGGKLSPNIWIILLGPSGYRKGTAIDFCRTVVEETDNSLLLPQVASEEGLTKVLAETATGLITWQEFSKTLKVWNKEGGWQASQEYWINLYDRKSFTKQLSGGRTSVTDPRVSLLSASIPKVFCNFFRPEDLDLGFFGRMFFVVAVEKDRYFPVPPDIKTSNGYGKLPDELASIRERYPEPTPMDYSEIKPDFIKWAEKQQREQDELTGFNARIETHCMKLAMIYEATLEGEKVISTESLRYGIAALDFFKACMKIIASQEIGLSSEEKKIKQIVAYIRIHGEASRSDLMNALHLSAYEMNRFEETLGERQLIHVDEQKTTGRSKTVYTAL